MNFSRRNEADSFSESDLIAFHLHELLPEQERAILRAMAVDPALMAESESVAASLIALKDIPMHVDQTVLDRHWKALRPTLIPHARPVLRMRRWSWPVYAGAMVASAAVIAFFAAPRSSAPPPSPQAASTQLAPTSDQPLSINQPAGGNTAASGRSLHTPSTAQLRTGVFRSNASRPEAPIHLLSPAQIPAMPPLAPRFTTAPAPPVFISPNAVASPFTDGAASPFTERPSGSKRTTPGAVVTGRREHTLDVMLGVGGNFIAPHTSVIAVTEHATQSATHAIAAVGALHQQFRPALGYRVTASYSRPDFNYTYGSSGGINSRIYELAGTYVIQGPHHKRLSSSADAGAGLLAFLPTVSSTSTSYVYRAAGVLGVNVDYAITRHWGARLAYRAQVFKFPNFRYTGGTIPVMSSVTVSNEPTLGITYTFGKQ